MGCLLLPFRLLVFVLKLPGLLIASLVRELMLNTTMLINHPVLLIGWELLAPLAERPGLPPDWLESVRRRLADPRIAVLLGADRILAMDRALNKHPQKLSFLLNRSLSEDDLMLLAAVNLEAAVQTSNSGLIQRCCLTLASRCQARGAVERARTACQQAESVARRAGDDRGVFRALQHQLVLLSELGEWDSVREALVKAAALKGIDARQRSLMLLAHASVCLEVGLLAEAKSLIEEATKLQTWKLLIIHGSATRSLCHAQAGRLHFLRGEWAKASVLFERAIADRGDKASITEYAAYLYNLRLRQGDAAGAATAVEVACSKEAVDAAGRELYFGGDLESRRQAFRYLCFHGFRVRDFVDAEEFFESGVGLVRDCLVSAVAGDAAGLRKSYAVAEQELSGKSRRLTTAQLLRVYAEGLLNCGLAGEAEAVAQRAMLLFRETGSVLAEAECLLLYGTILNDGNQREAAERAFDRAVDLAVAAGVYQLRAEGLLLPVELGLAVSVGVDARLSAVLELARGCADGELEVRTLLQLGHRCLRAEPATEANQQLAGDYFGRAVELSQQISDSDLLQASYDLLGWSLEVQGRMETARRHYRDAVEAHLSQRLGRSEHFASRFVRARLRRGLSYRSVIDSAIRLALAAGDAADVIEIGECFRARRVFELMQDVVQSDLRTRFRFHHSNLHFRSGEAILVYTVYQAQRESDSACGVVVHVLTAGGLSPAIVLEADWILTALEDVSSAIRMAAAAFQSEDGSLEAAAAAKRTMTSTLAALSKLLLPAAVLQQLDSAGASILTFVADARLATVPFTALFNHREQRFLIDDYEITAVSSLQMLMICRGMQRPEHQPVLLAVAEPTGTNLADSGDAAFMGTSILPLFEKYELLQGSRATMRRFLETAGDADCLHLMLHGYSHENSRQGKDQAVEFASDSQQGGNEEFSSRRLLRLISDGRRFPRCRMLTMNTCFSAEVVGGDPDENEPGGFPAAVMAMGVPIFVGAGWQLYTNPGRLFFAEFYRQLRTEPCAAGTAFRLSLLRMRQYRGPHGDWPEPYFDHPYTWGCLQLTGDGGRVL